MLPFLVHSTLLMSKVNTIRSFQASPALHSKIILLRCQPALPNHGDCDVSHKWIIYNLLIWIYVRHQKTAYEADVYRTC
jgi:hypothetical protein